MATIIRDKSGKVIAASRDSGVKVGSKLSDSEAKEASKKKNRGKRKITYTTSKGGSYSSRAEAEAALKAPQVEQRSAVQKLKPLATRNTAITSGSNIFSENPDVVAKSQEEARLAKELKDLQDQRERIAQAEAKNVSVKEKSAVQKALDFNRAGVQRVADAGRVVKNKVVDVFAEKDEAGRVVIKKDGKVVGSRTTTKQALSRSLDKSKSTGEVLQNVATDFLVDPITILTAPLVATKAVSGGKAVAATAKASKAVKTAKAAEAANKATKAAKATSILTKTGQVAGVYGKAGAKVAGTAVVFDRVTSTAYPLVDEAILKNEAKARGIDENKLREAVGQARREGFRGAKEAQAQAPFYKQLAAEINVGFGDKRAYEKEANYFLQSQTNLSSDEKTAALNVVARQRGGRAVTQLGGDLAASTAAELIGRQTTADLFKVVGKTTSTSVKKTALRTAGLSAAGTAPAGFFEGFTNELNQQAALDESKNIRRATVMGGFGAASTTVLSSTIAGTQTAKALGSTGVGAKLATPINIGANLIDPYEFVGDITASGIQKGTTKITGSAPLTAVITTTKGKGGAKDSFTLTTTGGKEPKGKTKPFNPLDNFKNMMNSFTQSKSQANTYTRQKDKNYFSDLVLGKQQTNTKTPANIFEGGTGRQKTLTNPFTFSFTQEEAPNKPSPNKPQPTPTQPPPNIPSDVMPWNEPNAFIQSQAEQPVQTTAVTNAISINVPTATPQFRFLPPLPLGAPNLAGYGGAGYKAVGRKKFVNELDFAIGSILGQNKPLRNITKTKRGKKRK